VGIALGDVLFSVVMILLLVLPILIDKGYRYQKVVVRTAKKMGHAAVGLAEAGKDKLVGSTTVAASSSALDPHVAEIDEEAAISGKQHDQHSFRTAVSSPGGDSAKHLPAKQPSTVMTLMRSGHGLFDGNAGILWLLFAIALFITGTVLLIVGIDYVYTSSVLSYATDILNVGSVAYTLKIILIVGVSLIGFFDFIAVGYDYL
jgi:hypothetical protein